MAARGDDTKGLKGTVIEWIIPVGQVLRPHLSRNSKIDRGFHHEITGALLCPTYLDWANPMSVSVKCSTPRDTDACCLKSGQIAATGDAWPMFLYANSVYDDTNPWEGLFRSQLLLNVREIPNTYAFVF